MKRGEIKSFVKGALHYFQEVTGEPAIIGRPWKKGDAKIILDYTGIIGISGKRRGCVYITSPRIMLNQILDILALSHSQEERETHLIDLAGEMANTIVGHARSLRGCDIEIAVPVVVTGGVSGITLRTIGETSTVVPLFWKDHGIFLVVGIQ